MENKLKQAIQEGISWGIGFGVLAVILVVVGFAKGSAIQNVLIMGALGGGAGFLKGLMSD